MSEYRGRGWTCFENEDDENLAKATRRIVMGSGKMKEVSARQKKQIKRKTDKDIWFGCLFPVVRSGSKLNLARIFFHNKTWRWPEDTSLPLCQHKDSIDWSRRAADVYTQLNKRR